MPKWHLAAVPVLLVACHRPAEVGLFTVTVDRKTGLFSVDHAVYGPVLEDARVLAGEGAATVDMQFGAFRFEDESVAFADVAASRRPRVVGDVLLAELLDGDGAVVAALTAFSAGAERLVLEVSGVAGTDRLGLSAACDADDHFVGLGGHAMDVDHVGEAFSLWVSEPGIGKSDDDEPTEDWFYTGTKHATSLPVPFLNRAHRAQGLLLNTTGRVDVELCASDAGRFSAVAWHDGALQVDVLASDGPLGLLRAAAQVVGTPPLAPGWAFAPWNDAIRGADEVRSVAATLREAGAPGSAMWTEDWKGGEEGATGYHLSQEWHVDDALYPDAAGLADELSAQGYAWLGYFAPFVQEGTDTWDEAVAADALILDTEGEPYTFTGFNFQPTSMVDISGDAGEAWAAGKMSDALDLGFVGWMADFAEWLPTDAVLAGGQDALSAHNAYPLWWQALNGEVLAAVDGVFFARSGWLGTSGLAPVIWGGDQRTDFQADDGFPTVVAMGLSLAASGIPVFSHDVAGYQSTGNAASTKELWMRWASLGAFSPVMRTHHGAFDTDNWRFDADAETLAHWVAMAREHMRLWPYRYGLAARASDDGTPMILPPAFVYDDDWGRTDAWLLGEALLVAPVLEEGATGRDVVLPAGVDWVDWWTHAPAESGWVDADWTEIPVFAASGTLVPAFALVPDTLWEGADEGLVGFEEADAGRVLTVFGEGGAFTEADGTSYSASGAPLAEAEAEATLTSGTIEAGGVTVAIDGSRERTYRVVIVP